MPTYTVNQYYLGNFTDLDPIEATDLDNANSLNENLSATNLGGGTNFGAGATFGNTELQMTSITQNDIVREGATNRLEENDYENLSNSSFQLDPDSFTYDLGGGPITSEIDNFFVWNATVLLGNGTTTNIVLSMVQLENGAIFTQTTSALDNLNIQSITFTTPFTNPSDYYGFSPNRSIDNGNIVCFAQGTRILTDKGEVAIEDISVGDMVQTMDHGLQPVRWIGSRRLDRIDLTANPKLRPIRIAAGCLDGELPRRDLVVSPQHRILIKSKIAQRMFGATEVLGAAKQFLRLDGFDIVQDAEEVTYFHMLFDQHEIVFSEGAPTESLFTGPVALQGVGAAARREILEIMPDIAEAGRNLEGARKLLSGRTARTLASRHLQSKKHLLADA